MPVLCEILSHCVFYLFSYLNISLLLNKRLPKLVILIGLIAFSLAFFIPPSFLFRKMWNKWVILSVFGIFIAVYIARMFLYFPHTVPMNYNYDSLLGGFFK